MTNNDWLLTATCVSNWYPHLPLLFIIKVVHYCKVRHIGQIKGEAPTHLPETRYNWKTNSGMNVKVGDIIQYYAYKILDVLDLA